MSVSDVVVVSQAKKNVGIFQLQWELQSPSGRCVPIILCTYEYVAAERQKNKGDKVLNPSGENILVFPVLRTREGEKVTGRQKEDGDTARL